MKVYAESQPAKTVPYLHLGYTAATSLKPPAGFGEVGILMVLAGALLAFKLVAPHAGSGWGSRTFQFRRTVLGRVGLGLFVGGIGLYMLGVVLGRSRPPTLDREMRQANQCVNHLKQVLLGIRIYADDNDGKYPQHLLAASNELFTPKILFCPADTKRKEAAGWAQMSAANLSYESCLSGCLTK